MRIKTLHIHNYRSIRDLSLECGKIVTLLGPNNHGKSNILSSLDFLLSTSARPSEHDFFLHREPGSDELWVEASFSDLTAQERTTFKRYVLPDATIRIRKTAKLTSGSVEISYNGWVNEPKADWLKRSNAGQYANRESVSGTPLSALVPPIGRITKLAIEDAQE